MAAALASLFAANSARAADSYAMPPPGYTPDMKSDEAGMWMQVDRLEDNIKSSPARIRDEKLNAYLQGLVCKLAGGILRLDPSLCDGGARLQCRDPAQWRDGGMVGAAAAFGKRGPAGFRAGP